MATIAWCRNQKRGIKLIEPNDNLSEEYIRTAEETLDILKSIRSKSRVWLATTKYYCEYFAIYSLLMKIGIKCEMHDCTIAICQLLEDMKIIPQGYTNILEEDKKLRIDNQYYLKNREVPLEYDMVVNFVMTIKGIAIKITTERVTEVRKRMGRK